MYCLECGKEIPDNSKFCSFCGVSQNMPTAPFGEHFLENKTTEDSVKNNKWSFDFVFFRKSLPWLVGWIILHLSILLIWAYSILPVGYRNDDFFPFTDDISQYDIREFIFYTIVPFALIIIWSMMSKNARKRTKIFFYNKEIIEK